jgi:GntR family transcriptional regulator
VVLDDIWLPGSLQGPDGRALADYKGPMYGMFEARVRRAHGARRRKDPRRAADASQAPLLQVPVGSPLLSVERLSFTYGDKPVELRRGLYRTDSTITATN